MHSVGVSRRRWYSKSGRGSPSNQGTFSSLTAITFPSLTNWLPTPLESLAQSVPT